MVFRGMILPSHLRVGAFVELEELKQAVRAMDPAALLVSPRVLRRILQEEYKVPALLVEA